MLSHKCGSSGHSMAIDTTRQTEHVTDVLTGFVLFLCLIVFVNYRGNKVPRWIGVCLLAAMLLVFVTESLPAQSAGISSGATVYIEPMNGYENYLAAAFAKKHVPLAIVSDRNRARYLITSTIAERPSDTPAVVINNDIGNTTNGAFQNGCSQLAGRVRILSGQACEYQSNSKHSRSLRQAFEGIHRKAE